MRKRVFGLMAVLFLPAMACLGAEQASARLFCLSLQFQSVTQVFGVQSLALSSASFNPANGELYPLFNLNGPSHGSAFLLRDPDMGVVRGSISINVPALADTTGDGFSDFFKTSRAVPSTTTGGLYQSDDGIFSGTVSATWSRNAGSASGTCLVKLIDSLFPTNPSFSMPFALIEYQGTLNYSGGATNVDAAISLARTSDGASLLSGPLEFFRSSTNRANQILLQAGTLTNNQGQPLGYASTVVQRDLNILTNYFATLLFSDGNPATPEPDYLAWQLSINDANDGNGNGVPDLTDPAIQPPVSPQLSLASAQGGLILRVAAQLGRQVVIQSASRISDAAWVSSFSFIMTNNTQTMPLPKPAANQFWRAVVFY